MLSWQEVVKHDSRESCWVVIRGQVYDLTTFIDHHPGGGASILRYGGKDGTEEYESLHALGTIHKTLTPGTSANPFSLIIDQRIRSTSGPG